MGTLQIRPLGYALGAEITGFDLRRPLPDETVAQIREAWLDRIVLCFPGQDLDPEEMMAFCGRFAELDDNRSIPAFRHPDSSLVSVLVNKPLVLKDRQYSGAIVDQWHTDLSFTDRPSTASFLNAKELPDIGGNTMFTNMYTAYESLSPALQRMLEPLEAVHDVTLAGAYQRLSPQEQPERKQLAPPVVHPVVRVHPETGRKALYVGNRIRHFVGMTEEETRPLVDFLNRHATQYEFTYRHVWSVDDLLMWDNRCAMHYAVPDYDLSQTRRMQRCSLLAPKSGYLYDALAATREAVGASG
jgi:taurine dioxygenase